ncbi:hypothetical protein BDZ97DRAFT_235004 [Flammula alnicola]|nr:hypothetical protein BDZ97DRAFT_235004 [Flammula alnicola]
MWISVHRTFERRARDDDMATCFALRCSVTSERRSRARQTRPSIRGRGRGRGRGPRRIDVSTLRFWAVVGAWAGGGLSWVSALCSCTDTYATRRGVCLNGFLHFKFFSQGRLLVPCLSFFPSTIHISLPSKFQLTKCTTTYLSIHLLNPFYLSRGF